MLPIQHFFLSIIFILVLFFLFPQISILGLLIILFSAVLIDIDHYLYYIWAKKDLSLRNAYKWHANHMKYVFCFLHGFEVLVILYLLGVYLSNYFFFILIGFSFHLFLDILAEIIHGFKIHKISVIYDFFLHKSFLNK